MVTEMLNMETDSKADQEPTYQATLANRILPLISRPKTHHKGDYD